jgi:hypothetical protein
LTTNMFGEFRMPPANLYCRCSFTSRPRTMTSSVRQSWAPW